MAKNAERAAAIAAALITYRSAKKDQQVLLQPARQLKHANPWGLSARRDTMTLRRLYQLRLYKTMNLKKHWGT